MMVLLILSVFSVMAIQSIQRGRNKAGAQGLALVLSEELRRVRQEAIARRRPTALVLPTNAGKASSTRSFYVMDGETLPRIVRTRNFLSEFGVADIFMGKWNLASGSWASTSLSVPGSKWDQFRVDTWLPAGASALKDYCFVFLPDGTVRTNDLLSYDNRYHLVVAAGANYNASVSNATLTGAGEAYTVSISPIGGVTMSGGIYGESGAIAASGRHSTEVSQVAPVAGSVPPEIPEPINSMPKIFPTPNADTLPGGADPPDALITKDQYCSLEMQAKSSSGEQLFCQWKVDGPAGKTGAFSLQSQSTGTGAGGRMEWDQTLNGGAGAWTASWQWRPPADAVPAERYTLTCEVQNIETGEVTVQIKKFDIKPPGKIFFESNRSGAPAIFTMDESGQRERLYLANAKNPTATLNGRRLIYVKTTAPNAGELFLHIPLDTQPDTQLTSGLGDCEFPAISPSGNLVAFYRGSQIYVMKVGAGANPMLVPGTVSVRPSPVETLKLGWTKDGNNLLYPDGNNLMFLPIDASGGPPTFGVASSHSTATGAVSSATDTFDNGVIYTDNYAPYYDPWIKRDDTNDRQYLSIGFEDSSVERNPRGAGQFMICRGPAPAIGARQLHIVTITGPSNATVGPPLTSAGSNTRPVWTQ